MKMIDEELYKDLMDAFKKQTRKNHQENRKFSEGAASMTVTLIQTVATILAGFIKVSKIKDVDEFIERFNRGVKDSICLILKFEEPEDKKKSKDNTERNINLN